MIYDMGFHWCDVGPTINKNTKEKKILFTWLEDHKDYLQAAVITRKEMGGWYMADNDRTESIG